MNCINQESRFEDRGEHLDRGDASGGTASDRIRANIDRTRAQMDETVDELQSRLTLDNLTRSGLEMVRDGAGATVKKVGRVIRENPLPSAVIAAGLVWMIVNKTSRKKSQRVSPYSYGADYGDEDEYYGEYGEFIEGSAASGESAVSRMKRKASRVGSQAASKAREVKEDLKQSARNVGHRVKETLHDVGSTISEKSHELGSRVAHTAEDLGHYAKDRAVALGHQVQHGAQRGKEWFVDTVDDNPLAVGAAFFAMGLAGGMSVPTTRKENELLGPMRDDLVDRAQAAGAELLHRGEEAAERLASCAKDAVSDQGSTPQQKDKLESERENSF